MPLPCCTVPATVPPVTIMVSAPSPWLIDASWPSTRISVSFPAACVTAPLMEPSSISRRSLPAPKTTPAVCPVMVPRLIRVPSALPLNSTPLPAWLAMRPLLTTVLPAPAAPSMRMPDEPAPLTSIVPSLVSTLPLPLSEYRPLAFAPVVTMLPPTPLVSALSPPLAWMPSDAPPAVAMAPVLVTVLPLPSAKMASKVSAASRLMLPSLLTWLWSRTCTPGPAAICRMAPSTMSTVTSVLPATACTPVVCGLGTPASQVTV